MPVALVLSALLWVVPLEWERTLLLLSKWVKYWGTRPLAEVLKSQFIDSPHVRTRDALRETPCYPDYFI